MQKYIKFGLLFVIMTGTVYGTLYDEISKLSPDRQSVLIPSDMSEEAQAVFNRAEVIAGVDRDYRFDDCEDIKDSFASVLFAAAEKGNSTKVDDMQFMINIFRQDCKKLTKNVKNFGGLIRVETGRINNDDAHIDAFVVGYQYRAFKNYRRKELGTVLAENHSAAQQRIFIQQLPDVHSDIRWYQLKQGQVAVGRVNNEDSPIHRAPNAQERGALKDKSRIVMLLDFNV